MHPITGERLSSCEFTLRDFVLVVRKKQVFACNVHVQRFTEVFHCHSGAFNVPPRSAFAPGAIPGWFTRFGGFPKVKVPRVFLTFIDFDACACEQIFRFPMRQLAVFGEGVHSIVNASINDIGGTFVNKTLDEG